ncbi:MAG: phenylalanine--tRNA ligase subunit beta, partial [Bacteroidales bacterium]
EQLVGCGFNEILNNSLTKRSYYTDMTRYPEGRCVELMNPLSNDLSVMRQTLLFGGLESISYNRNRRNGDLQLFEFGNCYQFIEENRKEDNLISPYQEQQMLGLWICGNHISESWAHQVEKSSVYHLKAYVENILRRLGVSLSKVVMGELSNEIYSNGMVVMSRGGKELASFGIISKAVTKQFSIDTEVYYAELNWNLLMREIRNNKVSYSEISKFPSVKRDLALLVDSSLTFAEIKKAALAAEKKLLQDIYLFDVYEGKNLPEGKKSYAVSFIIQDPSKTLTDKQIEAIMAKIQKNIEELGATLR